MNTTKVDQPTIGTFLKCPVTLRHEDPDGWYYTNTTVTGPDPVIYISSLGARMLAEAEGYKSPSEHARVLDDLAAARAELDQAVEEISELRKLKESYAALEAAGYKPVRPGGRPSRKTSPEQIREDLKEKAGVSG